MRRWSFSLCFVCCRVGNSSSSTENVTSPAAALKNWCCNSWWLCDDRVSLKRITSSQWWPQRRWWECMSVTRASSVLHLLLLHFVLGFRLLLHALLLLLLFVLPALVVLRIGLLLFIFTLLLRNLLLSFLALLIHCGGNKQPLLSANR